MSATRDHNSHLPGVPSVESAVTADTRPPDEHNAKPAYDPEKPIHGDQSIDDEIIASITPASKLKTYTIVSRKDGFADAVVEQNGQPRFFIEYKKAHVHRPVIYVRQAGTMDVLAAAKPRLTHRGIYCFHGDPQDLEEDLWPVVDGHGFSRHDFTFKIDSVHYAWRRAHAKDFGAAKGNNSNCYKLVDTDSDNVLAVLVARLDVSHTQMARLDYFAELTEKIDSITLAVALAIEEQVFTF